jgi:hypothetical protein
MQEVTFNAVLLQFPSSPLWGLHFIVPADIAQTFINGKNRRVICTVNDTLTLHCALMPNKDTWFIMLNQEVRKKLKIAVNQDIKVVLAMDDSEYGMPMAEELREVLYQDPIADQYFHALTPGKQRSLIYLINKIKSPDIRILKCLVISDHLTANSGKIDSKMLYEALKNYSHMT